MSRDPSWHQLVPDFPFDDANNPWFIDFGNMCEIQGSWMKDGKRIDPLPKIDGLSPRGDTYCCDYMLSENGWPLFSDAAALMFTEMFPGSVQFIPFRFRPRYSKQWVTGYNIGQILHVVDAIDRKRTQCANNWIMRPNGTYDVRYPVWIQRKRVNHLPVFRLKGEPIQIWVSDDLRKEVARRGLTGFRFAEAFVG